MQISISYGDPLWRCYLIHQIKVACVFVSFSLRDRENDSCDFKDGSLRE